SQHYFTCYGYCPYAPWNGYYTCYGACPSPPVAVVPPDYVNAETDAPINPASYQGDPEAQNVPRPEKNEPTFMGKTVDDWVKDLRSSDPAPRGGAASVLGFMGPKAKAAIPALVKALADSDSFVRLEATQALARMGTAAVPALTAALKDRDRLVR